MLREPGARVSTRRMKTRTLRTKVLGPFTILIITLLAGATQTACQQSASSALTVAIADWPGSLDPDYARTRIALTLAFNVYEQIMKNELKSLPNGSRLGDPSKQVPQLLDRIEASDDGKTWTLTVRKDQKFSDGTPITAETLRYLFERGLALTDSGSSFIYTKVMGLTDIANVKIVGPMQLTVTTNNIMPYFPKLLTLSNTVAKNPALIKHHATSRDPYAKAWLAQNTAGYGPYSIASWTQGTEIVLRANPDYVGDPKAKIAKVILRLVPDSATRLQLLRTGALDVAEYLTPEQVSSLKGANGITVVSQPRTQQLVLVLVVNKPPCDNLTLRQALSYAVPYEKIIQGVYYGQAQATYGPLAVGIPGHTHDGFPYTYDVNKAKKLLEQTEFAKGLDLTLSLADNNPEHEAAAIIIQAALKDVGISVTLDKQNPSVLAKAWPAGNLQMYLKDMGGSILDGAYQLSLSYTTGSYFNFMKYSNTDVDDLMAQVNATTDEIIRLNLFQSIQQKIWADAPAVWLLQPDYSLAMRNNIGGYANTLSDAYIRYKYLTKE